MRNLDCGGAGGHPAKLCPPARHSASPAARRRRQGHRHLAPPKPPWRPDARHRPSPFSGFRPRARVSWGVGRRGTPAPRSDRARTCAGSSSDRQRAAADPPRPGWPGPRPRRARQQLRPADHLVQSLEGVALIGLCRGERVDRAVEQAHQPGHVARAGRVAAARGVACLGEQAADELIGHVEHRIRQPRLQVEDGGDQDRAAPAPDAQPSPAGRGGSARTGPGPPAPATTPARPPARGGTRRRPRPGCRRAVPQARARTPPTRHPARPAPRSWGAGIGHGALQAQSCLRRTLVAAGPATRNARPESGL